MLIGSRFKYLISSEWRSEYILRLLRHYLYFLTRTLPLFQLWAHL